MTDSAAVPATPPVDDHPDGPPGSGTAAGIEVAGLSTAGTLFERMGLVLLEAGPERVVGTMPVAGNTQPAGLLHGGASVVLAESLGSVAALLAAGPGRAAVGVEVSATHHRSVRPDPPDAVVTGVATALHVGRTLATYEIVITDAAGRRACTARLTCALVDARPS